MSDEKEKFDATAFRDSIFAGINESSGDLESLSKFLDISGNKLDYRRYGEPLFDILIAGGLLAPGGNIVDDPTGDQTRTEHSVFGRDGDDESIKAFAQVITKLIRRYKYLEKTLEEDLKKIVVFLKAFSFEEREKLAKFCAILLSGGQINTYILSAALQDHLVKDGIASEFLINVLKVWQAEKDANQVWTALRKSNLDSKILVRNRWLKMSPNSNHCLLLGTGLLSGLKAHSGEPQHHFRERGSQPIGGLP